MRKHVIATMMEGARNNDRYSPSSPNRDRVISLVAVERAGKSLEKSELETMSELPRDNADRAITLASMLYDSAVSFMKTHSLKLNMPEGSISRALIEGKSHPHPSPRRDRPATPLMITQSSFIASRRSNVTDSPTS